MKGMFFLSVLLHLCFFAATLLLSASLFEGSSRGPGRDIISVRIMSDRKDQGSRQSVQKQAYVPEKTARVSPEIIKENLSEPLNTVKKDMSTEEYMTRGIEIETEEAENRVESPSPEELHDVHEATGDWIPDNSNDTVMGGAVHSQQDGHYAAGLEMDINHYAEGSLSEAGAGDGLFPDDIIGKIRDAIEKNKTYPLIARKRRMEGAVYVGFRITPEGMPADIRIMKSSGFAVLDRATVDIVERAAPFPYINASLEVPVVFQLDSPP